MKITISGQAGSGKDSIAKLLAKKLNFNFYSIGDLRRKMALDCGLSLADLNKLGEKEDFTDKDVDEYQVKIGRKEDNFIVVGRLSYYFIPDSFKIFVDADIITRAQRILKAKREEEQFKDVIDAIKKLEKREQSDVYRYKKHYGINCYDKENYDLILDTTKLSPEQAVNLIIEKLNISKTT